MDVEWLSNPQEYFSYDSHILETVISHLDVYKYVIEPTLVVWNLLYEHRLGTLMTVLVRPRANKMPTQKILWPHFQFK